MRDTLHARKHAGFLVRRATNRAVLQYRTVRTVSMKSYRLNQPLYTQPPALSVHTLYPSTLACTR